MLDIMATPEIIKKNCEKQKIVLVLYGFGLCDRCPTGEKLHSLNSTKQDILYVIPMDYNNLDILKFKDAFLIKGDVITGDIEVVSFLKKFASCKKLEKWQNNILVEVNEKGKIQKIKKI
jgi:hypothetical protein